jgi:hypothetical protein
MVGKLPRMIMLIHYPPIYGLETTCLALKYTHTYTHEEQTFLLVPYGNNTARVESFTVKTYGLLFHITVIHSK